MEDFEKNKEYQRKKYHLSQLKKYHFLNYRKKFKEEGKKYYEYSRKEIDSFLEFLIQEIDKKDRLITSLTSSLNNQEGNHLFYQKLFHPSFDTDTSLLFETLSSKIGERTQFLRWKEKIEQQFSKFDDEMKAKVRLLKPIYPEIAYFPKQNKYSYKLDYLISFIQSEVKRVLPCVNTSVIFDYMQQFDANYQENIDSIKNEESNIASDKIKIADILIESLITNLFYTVIVQIIVYDFLHEDNSISNRNKQYKKLSNFLSEFKKISNKGIKYFSIKLNRTKLIEKDFFYFLILIESLLQEKEAIEFSKKIPDFKTYTEPLSKEVQFFNALNILKKLGKDYIFCENFLELDIVKKYANLETATLDLVHIKNNINLSQADKAEILYGKRTRKHNFEKEIGNIEKCLANYPFFNNLNLQIKKAIISIILQDKSIIYPFRKQLKSLINDEKNRDNITIIKHLRIRITKEMYKEKGIQYEFHRSNELQENINEIFLGISSIKNYEKRLKMKAIFIKAIFSYFEEIENRNILIIERK